MVEKKSLDPQRGRFNDGFIGFDVTVRRPIGRVILGDDQEELPEVAAFKMIARYGEDGVFEFPGPHEGIFTRVVVTWEVEGLS